MEQMIELSAGGFTLGPFISARKCFSVPLSICWETDTTMNAHGEASPNREEKELLGRQRWIIFLWMNVSCPFKDP